ncbi:MAG: sigH [Chthoniobacteraceae bacterium]|nr:sigH [Chthoniobacteraceae bacterium]
MPLDLRHIYDSHAQALSAFLINVTRSEGETHEILQELFLKLATRPDLLDGVRSVRGFLIRLAHNLVIDAHRRRTTRDGYVERVDEVILFARTSDPDAAGFGEALGMALSRLPADQRAVVHLKLWEQMTFSEIAAALEISANTAASRYRYGLDKLQALLLPVYQEL